MESKNNVQEINMKFDSELRANTIVSQNFGLQVDHVIVTSVCELNFRLVSLTLCIVKLTTLAQQIK